MIRSVEADPALGHVEVEALTARHSALIAAALPEAQTSLSGSTLLGHYGGHDLDLIVLVPNVEDAAKRLRQSYPPLYEEEWRDDWAAFRDPGPPQVDVVLTKPGGDGDAHHRRAWELILADSRLRDEYETLKAAGMDSVRKAQFFDRIVALLRRKTD